MPNEFFKILDKFSIHNLGFSTNEVCLGEQMPSGFKDMVIDMTKVWGEVNIRKAENKYFHDEETILIDDV